MSTTNRTIARAGIIVSGAFLASRLLGWLRVIVIGNAFGGESAQLDAFYAAFRIPDLLYQLAAAGALSSALIPMLAELFAKDETDRAWRLVSTIANLMLVTLAVLGAIVFVTAPLLVKEIIAPGFDTETQALTAELTRIMVLSATFLALGAVATSVLNSQHRFAAAAVAPICYNLAIIGAAVILAPSLGAIGLAIGVVAGAIAHLAVQLPPVRRLGYRWRPVADTRDPVARRTLALMTPRAIGLGATQITFVVVTALATTLGVGAVTAFTIAFTLLQIPIGIIGVPLGVVLFPSLSREVALGNQDVFRALLVRALRVIVFVMLPIAVLTAILPTESVALLFPTFTPIRRPADRGDPAGVLDRPRRPRPHRRPRPRVLRDARTRVTPVLVAVVAVVVNTTLAVVLVGPLGLPGHRPGHRHRGLARGWGMLILLWRRTPGLDLTTVGWVGHPDRRCRRPGRRDRPPGRTVRPARPCWPGRSTGLVGACRGSSSPSCSSARPSGWCSRAVALALRIDRPALYRRAHGRRAPSPAPT